MRTSRISKPDWHKALLEALAERSTCVRRKAAAIAFDKYERIVGMGYNGVPRGFSHCTDVPCEGAHDPPGDTSRCMAIHSEINCITNSHNPVDIVTMVCSATPCFNCGLVMANLPNLEVVYFLEEYADKKGIWVLSEAGVKVVSIFPQKKLETHLP